LRGFNESSLADTLTHFYSFCIHGAPVCSYVLKQVKKSLVINRSVLYIMFRTTGGVVICNILVSVRFKRFLKSSLIVHLRKVSVKLHLKYNLKMIFLNFSASFRSEYFLFTFKSEKYKTKIVCSTTI
jgi:hypothetical protein